MARICLNMIVKNEAHVIRRCLDNIGHIVDALAIVDTGSTDETIALMTAWQEEKKIPGKIISRPWVNFGHNRTEALRHGESVVKEILSNSTQQTERWYFFFMDADDLAYAVEKDSKKLLSFNKTELTLDAYTIEMRSSSISYDRTLFLRYDETKKWKWYGPVHEYVGENPAPGKPGGWKAQFGKIKGNYVNSLREGARSKDPLKYLRDALEFEKALLEEPKNDRYLYYRAQSYKDAGHADIAEKFFRLRAAGPGGEWKNWNDEYTYLAYVEAAKIRIERNVWDHETRDLLEKAFEKRPHRLEAPFWLVFMLRRQDKFVMGWTIAKDLVNAPYPQDQIFVDADIHTWRLADEAALCAYYANDHVAYNELSQRVLACPSAWPDVKKRVDANLKAFPPKLPVAPVALAEVKGVGKTQERLRKKLLEKALMEPTTAPIVASNGAAIQQEKGPAGASNLDATKKRKKGKK